MALPIHGVLDLFLSQWEDSDEGSKGLAIEDIVSHLQDDRQPLEIPKRHMSDKVLVLVSDPKERQTPESHTVDLGHVMMALEWGFISRRPALQTLPHLSRCASDLSAEILEAPLLQHWTLVVYEWPRQRRRWFGLDLFYYDPWEAFAQMKASVERKLFLRMGHDVLGAL